MALLPTLYGTALDGQPVTLPRDLPPMAVVLLVGLRHDARVDVGHWKRVLDAAGVPWISLPTSPDNLAPTAMAGIAEAMKAHVPESLWTRIIQIHEGGPGLLEAFGWAADDLAKVLVVEADGSVDWSHPGPYSEGAWEALQATLN